MSFFQLAIKRPVMTTMLLLVFILFGLLAYFSLPLNLTPDVNFPFVTVTTVYAGASPDQIETQITKPIEDEVSSISLINYVQSYSVEGASIVLIRFALRKDANVAAREVKDRIDRIRNDLPRDAQQPVVEKIDVQAIPVVDLVLAGDVDLRELYRVANTGLKDRLSQVEGVGKVNVIGGREREIRVELDNRVAFQNSISLAQLGQVLAAAGLEMPAGQFQDKGQEYSVKLSGNFASLDAIRQMEISTQAGIKPVSDVARVVDSGKDVRTRATFLDNKAHFRADNAVLLSVVKSPDGNTVRVAKAVKGLLPTLSESLPAGTRLEVVSESATFAESSVSDTLTNVVYGVALTSLVLLLFLHDLRSTIIIALSMPASIVSTFLFLRLSNISLNMMSLMGLSTVVGTLVMNSVVVLENIFRHKELGQSGREAAATGTAEVFVAVVASTLTNVAVFVPIASMSGMAGQFFRDFALAVTFGTLFSLITGFTLTPMLAALMLPDKPKKRIRIGQWLEDGFQAMSRGYRRILDVTLRSKKRSALLIVATVALFIATMAVAPRVGFEFMPALDEGNVAVQFELPQGYDLSETAQLARSIESRITRHDEVLRITTTLGQLSSTDQGTNLGTFAIKLVDVSQREESNGAFAARLTEELADIPNARIRVSAVSPFGGPSSAPVDFYLMGQDIRVLARYEARASAACPASRT